MMRLWRVFLGVITVLLLLFVFGAVFFSGLIFRWSPNSSSAVVAQVENAKDLDQYLRDNEAKVADLRHDLAKEILWADPKTKKQTPISIVYIHGFSASRGETAPLCDEIAKHYGANLFYTRLKAHGLNDGGEAFGEVQAQDWIDDAREALAIGRRIGERVVLIGMSTGAPLAIEVANENRDAKDIAALVLVSPNFSPRMTMARIISGPFGRIFARIFIGHFRGFTPINHDHGYYWTPRYRSQGIVAMMDLVNAVANLDLSVIKIPTFTIYSRKDMVVNVPLIVSRQKEFGSSLNEVLDLPQARGHEIAGHAISPDVVEPAAQAIEAFIDKALVWKR